MQARLKAIASPEEMAFLKRTFNFSVPKADDIRVKSKDALMSPRKADLRRAVSPMRNDASKALIAPSPSKLKKRVIPASPSARSIGDEAKSISFASSTAQTPGTPSKNISRVDSSTTANKSKSFTTSTTSGLNGTVTPGRLGRHSSVTTICSVTAAAQSEGVGVAASKTPRATPKASSLGSTIKKTQSSSRIPTATFGDSAQLPNTSKNLFGTTKLPRSQPVSSRYAQAAPVSTASASIALVSAGSEKSTGSNNSNGNGNKKYRGSGPNTRTAGSTDKIALVPKIDKSTTAPSRRPNTALSAATATSSLSSSQEKVQSLTSSGEFTASTSTSASATQHKSQSQRTPKRVPPVVPVVPSSPLKVAPVTSATASSNNVSKKVEVGKLFGLVGFKKVDAPQGLGLTPSNIITSSSTNVRPLDIDVVHLDRNMKEALQRSVTAKATLLAAEMAAENARVEASVAHAEAVAAARAIVREAEAIQTAPNSGKSVSGVTAVIPSGVSTVKTAAAAAVLSVPSKDVGHNGRDGDIWAKSNSNTEDLSPKREAENPFKGMF